MIKEYMEEGSKFICIIRVPTYERRLFKRLFNEAKLYYPELRQEEVEMVSCGTLFCKNSYGIKFCVFEKPNSDFKERSSLED